MGRSRVIDRQALLDAAERVVAREGATHLTLEAVAIEAGISKASVIYDYKTKHALIKAVVERAVARHIARLRAHIDREPDVPDRVMNGRLAAAATREISDEKRAVSLNLVAALACDRELRAMIQASSRAQIAEAMDDAADPRRTMLAFMALEGLLLTELLGFLSWGQEERDRLLADIAGLLAPSPPETAP